MKRLLLFSLAGFLIAVALFRTARPSPLPVVARPTPTVPSSRAPLATCPATIPVPRRAPALELVRLLPPTNDGAFPLSATEAFARAADAATATDLIQELRGADHALLAFTEAAAWLGVLRGGPATFHDAFAALPLLRRLETDDPRNAVPSLYLAYGLHRLGRETEADEELALALRAPEIRFPADEANRAHFRRALEHPSSLPAALALAGRSLQPDLFPLEDYLLDRIADGEPTLALSALEFAQRLLAAAEKRPAPESVRRETFSVAERIARVSWRKLHPGDALAPAPPALRASLLAEIVRASTARDCASRFPRLAERLREEL
jgi:hypothetical protein